MKKFSLFTAALVCGIISLFMACSHFLNSSGATIKLRLPYANTSARAQIFRDEIVSEQGTVSSGEESEETTPEENPAPEVEIPAVDGVLSFTITFTYQDNTSFERTGKSGDTITVNEIAAGTYKISATAKDWQKNPVYEGTTVVTLVSGETANVNLKLKRIQTETPETDLIFTGNATEEKEADIYTLPVSIETLLGTASIEKNKFADFHAEIVPADDIKTLKAVIIKADENLNEWSQISRSIVIAKDLKAYEKTSLDAVFQISETVPAKNAYIALYYEKEDLNKETKLANAYFGTNITGDPFTWRVSNTSDGVPVLYVSGKGDMPYYTNNPCKDLHFNQIEIGTGITSINDTLAAGYRSLQPDIISSVKLPSTLKKIEAGTFANRPIEAITIPASVTEIGENAFRDIYAKKLSVITLDWPAADKTNRDLTGLSGTLYYSNDAVPHTIVYNDGTVYKQSGFKKHRYSDNAEEYNYQIERPLSLFNLPENLNSGDYIKVALDIYVKAPVSGLYLSLETTEDWKSLLDDWPLMAESVSANTKHHFEKTVQLKSAALTANSEVVFGYSKEDLDAETDILSFEAAVYRVDGEGGTVEPDVEPDDPEPIEPEEPEPYTGKPTDIKNGLVTGLKSYYVSDVDGLRKLAEIVNGTDTTEANSLAGYTITQTADITINENVLQDGFLEPDEGPDCTPNPNLVNLDSIGKRKSPFSGTYDGNNHIISGLYIYQGHQGLGFIGNAAGAVIKNVVLLDACVINNNASGEADGSDDDRVGGLIGLISGENTVIENCTFIGVVGSGAAVNRHIEGDDDNGNPYEYIGGLVGRCGDSGGISTPIATATNCAVLARIYGNRDRVDVICQKGVDYLTQNNVIGIDVTDLDAATVLTIKNDYVKQAALSYLSSNTSYYTVRHLKQTVDGTDYEKADEQAQQGLKGNLTAAAAKTYTGFEAQPIEQKTIADNGSTIVEIKYDRKVSTVSYDDGIENETISVPAAVSYRFGETVNVDFNVGTRQGYIFKGFCLIIDKETVYTGLDPYTFTMGTSDVTVTAEWEEAITTLKTGPAIKSLFKETLNASEATHFAKSTTAPQNPEYYLDISNTFVPVWYDESDTTIYYYLSGTDKLYLNEDSSQMFFELKSLVSIDTSDFDTSNVTNMASMFAYCESLTSVDVSSFDTSNVTNMGSLFMDCMSLPSISVSNFDTHNVTSIGYMFFRCHSLTTIDVSGFDTSNVTNMSCMFYENMQLTSLDLTHFDTANVTDMYYMFAECHKLTSLDVTSFNTSKVTTTQGMFIGCNELQELDVTGFDTSSVTDMSWMFGICKKLTTLDLSSFDTGKATNMKCMFKECSGLTSINVSSFDTSSITNLNNMFYGCSSLTSLDISNFDMSGITNTSGMFSACSSLKTIFVAPDSDWAASALLTESTDMFDSCTLLTGGSGTAFDDSVTDKTYACVDGGTEAPGYFTAKATGTPLGFVSVNGATVSGEVADSEVFITDRSVTIPNLYVCDHEVTQAEYEAVCSYKASEPSSDCGLGDNFPAYYVSWYDALVYCNKKSLSEGLIPCYTISGSTNPDAWGEIPDNIGTEWDLATCNFNANGYRLPTEAEWEYIARGGNNGIPEEQTEYCGSDSISGVAWYTANSSHKAHEIKGKSAGTLEIFDMCGNVWEWCWDWSGEISKDTAAAGPIVGASRVSRGGSWLSDGSSCTVYYRDNNSPAAMENSIGFRVVRTAK